jgi:hypothetical protein
VVLSRREALPSLRLSLVVLILLTALSTPARAGDVPTPERLTQMRSSAEHWNRFRVFTPHARHDLRTLSLDSTGVLLGLPQNRSALIQDADFKSETPRAHWAEIQKIEGTRSHAATGFIMGGVVGVLVGLAVMGTIANNSTGDEGLAILAVGPLSFALGGFVGAVIGSSSGWQPLYP